MKFYIFSLILLLIFFDISIAQTENEDEGNLSSASSIMVSKTVNVTATIIREVSVSTTGANTLNFGEFYATSSTQTSSITNQNGQKFIVSGNWGSNVIVTYASTVTLNNSAWILQNGGGTSGSMTFSLSPLPVHTLANSTYTSPVTLNSGSSVILTNSCGIGTLYIWIGGQLTISANQPAGEYIGTFSLNVSY